MFNNIFTFITINTFITIINDFIAHIIISIISYIDITNTFIISFFIFCGIT